LSMLPSLSSKTVDLSSFSWNGSGNVHFNLQGIDADNLVDALLEKPHLLKFFDEPSLDRGLVYNHASFTQGKYIVISRDGDYEIALESEGTNVVKNLIVVEENVHCRILFRLKGNGELHLANTISVKPGGNCSLGFFNNFGGKGIFFNRSFVFQDGVFDLSQASFHSFSRIFHETYLLGDRASGNIFDLYRCDGALDLNARVYCKGKHQKSLILSKGIVFGEGKVYFEGYAKIDKGAEHADLFVGQHALIMNLGAKAFLVPNLEIEHHQVKAGHSASVQQFDEEKLFYLQSRGLNEDQSKSLMIEGFLRSVLEKMNPLLQEAVRGRI